MILSKQSPLGGEEWEEGEDDTDGDKFFLIETEDTLNKTGNLLSETSLDITPPKRYKIQKSYILRNFLILSKHLPGVDEGWEEEEDGTIGENNLNDENVSMVFLFRICLHEFPEFKKLLD